MTTLFENQTDLVQPEATNMATGQLVEQRDVTPMQLIQAAVTQSDIDPDRLEKLMALQERWEKNEAQKAYNIAMKACQEEMPTVVSDSVNKHTKSKYPKLETVTRIIKPTYTKHGFSLSFGSRESPLPNHLLITCDCMHDKGHTRQYELNCPYDTAGAQGTANKTPIQGMGSSASYGRRYLKLMIFDVSVVDEDNDGQDAACITEQQLVTLNEWIESTNTDLPRFLKWLAIDKLTDMSAEQFDTAMYELKRKAKR
jgi:hypothetical protein